MNYQELFPKVLEKTYHNHKNISTPNLPKIKIKCLFNEKNVSLPFLDIINIDKLSLKDLAGEIKSEIRISESNPKIKHLRKVLVNKGFIESEVKGHIVSKLTTGDHMWEKFHKHTRNDIRMAEKSNLKLKKIDSKEELNIFYKLYLNEMRNFGTPQHSFKFFDNCLKIMKESFIG